VTRAARFVWAVLGLVLGTAVSARSGTVDLSVSSNGFQPKVVNVRKGETVRLQLTSAGGEHCFALDAWRIEKRIRPGQGTVVELVPDRAGTFPFYCCLESGAAAEREHGRLVVTE
jgi:heme/copper-type cytochrome/quinol oxidase subunit 2